MALSIGGWTCLWIEVTGINGSFIRIHYSSCAITIQFFQKKNNNRIWIYPFQGDYVLLYHTLLPYILSIRKLFILEIFVCVSARTLANRCTDTPKTHTLIKINGVWGCEMRLFIARNRPSLRHRMLLESDPSLTEVMQLVTTLNLHSFLRSLNWVSGSWNSVQSLNSRHS